MKKLATLGAALVAVVALAACGSSGSGSTSASSSGSSSSSSSGSQTVAVKQLPGVGKVLVDSSGMALYTPAQESGGTIMCNGACTTFWKPVTPGKSLGSVPGAGKLAVIKRPGGGLQVALGGKPLYTFSQDSPGKATGNGFTDAFGGQHFTWHVVRSNGTTSGAAGATKTPSSGSSNGGGYSY